ncbi:MAG: transcription elongation factor GreA [Candidatus Dadabacteria bacterium]|nr:MAG: transcription elongation factor GreA [Candidatus Dadabacteria bacterium]
MAGPLPIIERLQRELAELRRELSVELPKQLEEARAHGDISENAEYEAAKERQGVLRARIAQLEQRIRELSMYTSSSIRRDVAGYGSRVEVEDLETGERVVYELVFPEEADPGSGRVSMASPLGQALLHRRVGDEVSVRVPSGKRTFEIVGLETIHDRQGEGQQDT